MGNFSSEFNLPVNGEGSFIGEPTPRAIRGEKLSPIHQTPAEIARQEQLRLRWEEVPDSTRELAPCRCPECGARRKNIYERGCDCPG